MNTEHAILDNYLNPTVKVDVQKSIDMFLDASDGYCDIGRYSDSSILLEETEVVKDDRGCGYLVERDQNDAEAVVSLTGVLVEAELPPYKDTNSLYRTRPNKKDIPVNRVSLAWFGHGGYDTSRLGLENIRSTFSRKYDVVDKIPLPVKLGMPVISCENRVVSKVDHVPSDTRDAEIPKHMDPQGVIRKSLLQSNRNRFVADNLIAFAKHVPEPDSLDFKVVDCLPEEFKVGMIVCVQATPTVIPTTKGGNKVILKLRSMLLVDDAAYKRFLFSSRLGDIETLPKPGNGLKRKAGPPQWINAKRRALSVEDVQVRSSGEGGRNLSSGRRTDEEGLSRRLEGLTTKDKGGAVDGSGAIAGGSTGIIETRGP